MTAQVMTGARPDRLERIAMLSRGRTFEVWDCWDATRICRVVLKLPREERFRDVRARDQLVAEGRLLERLNHPHILKAYGTVIEPVPMIVMETLGGETLAHMVDETGGLEPEEIAHLGLHLCSAVAHLHSWGYAHLDLKPSNVIGDAGRARLIDLGTAAPFGDGRPEIGTWSYMAPEQVSGLGLGPHTDVWGLGATMFECLCGHPPFDDPDIEDGPSTGATRSDEDRPGNYPQLERGAILTGKTAGLAPDLDELILACLEPDPRDRPRMKHVAAGLEAVLNLPSESRRHSRSIP